MLSGGAFSEHSSSAAKAAAQQVVFFPKQLAMVATATTTTMAIVKYQPATKYKPASHQVQTKDGLQMINAPSEEKEAKIVQTFQQQIKQQWLVLLSGRGALCIFHVISTTR